MKPPIPKTKNIEALKKNLLDQINKQYEPTPQEKYNQAVFNRTWNPETMPADRLREFQSHGWFIGYEPRKMTPEQAAIEEQEFQAIANEAFPNNQKPATDKPLTPERAKEIIDEVWSKKRFVKDQPLSIIQNKLL